MKNLFPIGAAIGLAILWTALLFAVPAVMDLFADFKVAMSSLTLLTVRCSRLLGGTALPLLVLTTALLLRFRQVSGWALALMLCAAWDLGFVGLLMPIISLIDNLSGGDGNGAFSSYYALRALGSVPGVLLAGLLLLNQILFASLIFKRHLFFARPTFAN